MKFKRQVIKIYFLQIKLPNWQLSLTEYSSASNNIMHSKNWFWHLVQMFHPLPFGFKCPMSMFGGELHCKKTHSPVGCFVPSKRYSTHVGDNQKVRFELMTALDKARRALSEIQWIWVIFFLKLNRISLNLDLGRNTSEFVVQAIDSSESLSHGGFLVSSHLELWKNFPVKNENCQIWSPSSPSSPSSSPSPPCWCVLCQNCSDSKWQNKHWSDSFS